LSENSKNPIIDPHTSGRTTRGIRGPRKTNAAGEKDATPEMLLALMRANGVARTVTIQAIYYGWEHSYAAEVRRQYPQYFSRRGTGKS
jgi:hypothetical protein